MFIVDILKKLDILGKRVTFAELLEFRGRGVTKLNSIARILSWSINKIECRDLFKLQLEEALTGVTYFINLTLRRFRYYLTLIFTFVKLDSCVKIISSRVIM